MPPKIKVTKEEILLAAYEITAEEGYDAVNARSIAHKLQCSTQPIFTAYKNMEELKEDLFLYVNQRFGETIMTGITSAGFLGLGLAYVRFAREQSHLFRMMFHNEFFQGFNMNDLVEGEGNAPILAMIGQTLGIDADHAKRLFLKIWLFTHGIASFVCSNAIELTDSELEILLKETIRNFMGEK